MTTTTRGPLRLPNIGRISLLVLVVVLLAAGSVSLYWAERDKRDQATVLGDSTAPDQAGILVLVQKIDPKTATVSAQVRLLGAGFLMDEGKHALKEDVTILSNAVANSTVTFKAGERPEFVSVKFGLFNGVLTDYPFDSYTTNFVFQAFSGTAPNLRPIPLHIVFTNIDSFFQLAPQQEQSIRLPQGLGNIKTITPPEGTFVAAATVERSTSTVVFAVFIMVFMWSLTIAALIAAWYVGSGRLGLFWSGLGFLGTLLFALIPLRNAVPGDPPIGSLIDFAAFFIAEGVVSISMIVTVLHGYHIEAKKKQQEILD
ncbi:MAG: DUF4436 family protein [Segniliparus sp.]|uniref:DUF4436 family protein n=1 Tax=Segniliparus sp. TaxID=2804064 RepID=UPI003F3E210E